MKCICIDSDMREAGYNNHNGWLFKRLRVYEFNIKPNLDRPYIVKDEEVKSGKTTMWAPFTEESFNRHFRII